MQKRIQQCLLVLFILISTSAWSIKAVIAPSIEIFDQSATSIIDAKFVVEIIGSGFTWSEGPVWVNDGEFLLFTDVPQNTIYKYTLQDGVSEYLRPSGATGIFEGDSDQGANGLLINKFGDLVMMHHGDRRVAKLNAPLDKPLANFITLADNFKGNRFNSPNDGVFHSNGELYFTDPPYGLQKGRHDKNKALEFDGIYRLKNDGTVILENKTIMYPNGIVLSPNESKLYVAASDKNDAKWYVFEVNNAGALNNKKLFYDATSLVGQSGEYGLPDGMVMHSEGYLFATGPGGVFIFNEQGTVLAKIRTGKATSNCTLSADEKTLFITAHDTLMKVRLK